MQSLLIDDHSTITPRTYLANANIPLHPMFAPISLNNTSNVSFFYPRHYDFVSDLRFAEIIVAVKIFF